METRAVDNPNTMGTPPAPRSRRFVFALVLLVAVGIVVAVVLVTPAPPVAVNPVSRLGVATVQQRNLIQTDTEGGTLSYANPQTVYNRLSGTITWLPRVGQLIKLGQTLYSVNTQPVVLLGGTLPAYRTLKAGDRDGIDVLQLNRDLVQMGFGDDEIRVNDTWQAGTTDAVKRWQQSLGEKRTGEIALGHVVFLPGAQRIVQLDTTCGSVGGDAVSSASSSTGTTNGCGALLKASAGGSGVSGGDTTSASAILQTSSTRLVVTVDLAASSQSEATVGSRVTVEMPSGSTIDGTITAVSTVAQYASGNGSPGATANEGGGSSQSSAAMVPVTITLDRRVKGAGLDQAPVSVNFAQAKAKHVLSVPVTALVATSGASYAVQEAAAPQKLIPVNTGLFAAGYVQVSGLGIHPGLRVTDSQG